MALKDVQNYGQGSTRRTGRPGGQAILAPTTGPKMYQGPGDLDPPFAGGGRQADLPADYDQRAAADEDWRIQLARNARQDREALGIPKALDGTPWVGKGRR
jgi:hypothetical protein